MTLFKEAAALRTYIQKLKETGKTIGFVPTMGALHKGHISLIELSKSKCDITISSVFVNPTQFNDPQDFEKYPVTLGTDILQLENAGCDILFLPSVSEMYPEGLQSEVHYELGDIEFQLEGKYRPGHFQGVCRIVHKLLDIVTPDFLFLGQKDYQQCMVIKKLVELIKMPVTIIKGTTFRETSGLAMSSRNLRLSDWQKQKATGISKMLRYIKNNYSSTPPSQLEKHVSEYLLNNGFEKVDYVSIADADTLAPIVNGSSKEKSVALIAAFIGGVRLIDNTVLSD